MASGILKGLAMKNMMVSAKPGAESASPLLSFTLSPPAQISRSAKFYQPSNAYSGRRSNWRSLCTAISAIVEQKR